MKTKELIRLLQQEDPSGEIECCVGNLDIHFISREPAYYDGALQVLTRDETETKYYNIIGGKYLRTGEKIQFHTMSISDILDDPKATVDYSQLGSKDLEKRYKESDDKTRAQWRKIKVNNEWENFKRWVKEKAVQITGDSNDVLGQAREFFDKHIDPSAPLPTEKTQDEKDGKCVWDSYANRRHLQWNLEVDIEFDGMDWKFTKK